MKLMFGPAVMAICKDIHQDILRQPCQQVPARGEERALPGPETRNAPFGASGRRCYRRWGDIRTVGTPTFSVNTRCPHSFINVGMLNDAYGDAYDVALLVSADSDLSAPVDAIQARFPRKRVIVVCPPNRQSKRLESVASAYFRIGRKKLQDSQFPDALRKPDGFVLKRPPSWR